MKKTLSLLIAVILVLGMMGMSVSANRGYTYSAPYAVPTIDGNADDAAWSVADWTEIDYALGTSLISARAKVVHDDQLIYVLCETTDAEIEAGAEFIEFYLDEDNCKDETGYCDVCSQMRINIEGNHAAGTYSVGQVDMIEQFEITSGPNGYIWEFAIRPLTSIPTDPTVPFGLEFMYDDYDNSGAWVNALRWNVETNEGDQPPYQYPDNFGLLYFLEKPEEAPVETPDAPAENAGVAEEVPPTADAGIVVAAVVMAAAAAAVVLNKKH